jgi:DNA-binding LacI/PurR family transcriptional regulator
VETRRKRGTIVTSADIYHLAVRASSLPSHTIGVLVPSRNPFYAPYLQGIEDEARKTNDLLFTCYTMFDKGLPDRYTRQLIAKGVDGIIATSLASEILQAQSGPLPANLPPVVHVDDPLQKKNSIVIDNEGAANSVTEHLIKKHRYRRIGLITCPIAWQNVRDCYDGYRRALSEAGIEFDESLVVEVPFFTPDCGYQGAQHLLGMSKPARAIFAVADILAVGAVQAIKESGKRVPDDIAIAGYNNIEVTALMEPPLTTASVPTYQMGVEAMTMLNRLRAGQPIRQTRIVLQTELIIRKSCGC